MSFLRPLRIEEIEVEIFKNDRGEWAVVASWNGFHRTVSDPNSRGDHSLDPATYDAMFMEAMNDLHDAIDRAAAKLEPLLTQDSFNEWIVRRTHVE